MSALESAVGEAASSSGPAPRSIVIANAGSGKTWTLANRILRWSIDEVRAGRAPQPARALAVTFTRKAAGEILARVLSHAAQGARAGDDGAKARKEFRAVVGDATQAEYSAALKALAADLHRLSIGTIDGFFHRIATAMPEEVGLPAEWTLAEEHELEELRALAAAEILSDESADALLDLLEQGEPKPSVSSAIESRLGGASVTPLDMYRAVAVKGVEGVKGVEAVDRVFGWAEELEVDSGLTREGWDALLARCDALVPPRKKDGTPYQDFQRAWTKLQDELRNRDFRKIAKSTLFPRMVAGGNYGRARIPAEFQELAVQLAPHLRAALVKQLRDQMRAARELLPKADGVLARLQAERGLFGFADITRGVAAAAGREGSRVSDPTELRTALGVDLRDLAIDEAQDTSVEQFLSLRPLLEDVLGVNAPERAGGFLLVGDPKQSIYGWRGGTPGLIAEIAANYAAQLGPSEPLRKSFRSSPIIMDFVNRVFADYESDVLALAKDDAKGALTSDKVDLGARLDRWIARTALPADCTASAYSRALREWRFERHESAKCSLGGHIAAYAYGTVTGDDRGDPNADDIEVSPYAVAADIAARIAREHPERSVGILIRTNKGIAETIAELKRRGVAASDEGRAMLLDSPAVVGVLAMLRLVDRPDDRVSHFLVSRGPMAAVTGLPPLESHASTRAAHARAVEFASTMRARIADEGLAGVVRSALDALKGIGLSPIDAGRLARVVAIAEDFADAPPARLLDFIDAVEADTADSSSADRVRVMTVHRSKGLEFDEVICLTLDENWGETPKGWGVYRPTPSEPPRLVAPLFAEEVRAWVPELAVIERDERRRGILDDLSTFYVAVTRARRGLHLVMNHDDKGDYPTAAKLIRRALDRPPARPDALLCADELTPKWLDTVADASEAAKAEPFWESIYPGEEAGAGGGGGAGEDAGGGAGAEPHQHAGRHADAESAQPAGQGAAQSSPAHMPLVIVTPRRRGRAAPPSSHETNAVWGLDPFADDDIALRGVFVHECFREVGSIEELDDPARLDAIVAAARRRAAVEKGEPVSSQLAREVREMLSQIAAGRGVVGSVGHALAIGARHGAHGQAADGDGVRVHAELAFAREIDGAIVNGRIDRLVLSLQDGVVVGATIIDFKTGAVDSSRAALEAKIEGYRAQLASYGDAVAEMFSLPREAVRLELLFVDRREVVRLGPAD
jgi:ATP-dependent helicase/nuclease subunit A